MLVMPMLEPMLTKLSVALTAVCMAQLAQCNSRLQVLYF